MSRLDAAAIAEAAGILADCRLHAVALDALPAACRPADLADAYRIQQDLHAALEAGGRGALGGCKIGCTTPVMQRYLGIDHPCAGGIFSDTIHHTGARLRHADYRRPGVECEIAVRLGAALPAAGAPYATATVAPTVGAVMAAIEIVDDRYVDYGSLDAPTLIADDFFGAGCILGAPVHDWQDIDLAAVSGTMAVNGATVGAGVGGDILGSPLAALVWLANDRAGRGDGLAAGDVVMLGSVVKTYWMAAGDRVDIAIEHLGEVGATLA